MADKLRIKAFLQYPEGLELGASPEVRRFKIKRTESMTDLHENLIQKLKRVFPDIQRLDYSLFWKGNTDIVLI